MKSYSEYREFSGVLGSDELKAEAFLLNYLSFKLSVLGLDIAEKELLQSPLFIKEVASLITFLHDLHGDIYLDVEGAALDGYRTPDEPGYKILNILTILCYYYINNIINTTQKGV
ncbi:hypothetical protein RLOatenuis_1780 [Rickettsiales bacterium]|nr:hypothetical protein RLOatenuis_1780 [Rickettsiales bacterium]